MEEKNLLLLSMSTLNKKDLFDENTHGEHTYFYGEDEFQGISQLEPGTKYFLQNLQRENRKINRIYIIASEATRKTDSDIIQYIQENNLLPETDSDMSMNMNTVNFFIERIRQYIIQKKLSYTKEEMDNLFQIVPLNDETDDTSMNPLYESINLLCNYIRREKSETKRVNLFINMQGGRRNEVFIINAAVNMMEKPGSIIVEASDAIEYDPRKNTHRIEDTTINDRIFEMVSGINEFMKTGRGDTLRDFMNDTENLETTGLNKEKPIIKSIIDISDAISLCDVKGFDNKLNELYRALQYYNTEVPDDQKNKLFQSILQNLEDDYGALLSDEESNTIDQVNWCISKKLYQQALTVVEAKIPDDIVQDSIIYFRDQTQMEEIINKNSQIPSYVNDSNFALIKYCIDKEALRNNCLTLDTNKIRNVSCRELTGDNITPIVQLLNNYFEIAQIRNLTNHAVDSEDRPDINGIKGILNDFCEFYCEFSRNQISVDLSDFVTIYSRNKEMDTFMALPIEDRDELRQKLIEIWDDDQQAQDDFIEINNAILQMRGLSWGKFKEGKSGTYFLLDQLLDYTEPGHEHVNDDKKRNRFRTKKGKRPYERFVNSVKRISGFYPEHFHRVPHS